MDLRPWLRADYDGTKKDDYYVVNGEVGLVAPEGGKFLNVLIAGHTDLRFGYGNAILPVGFSPQFLVVASVGCYTGLLNWARPRANWNAVIRHPALPEIKKQKSGAKRVINRVGTLTSKVSSVIIVAAFGLTEKTPGVHGTRVLE